MYYFCVCVCLWLGGTSQITIKKLDIKKAHGFFLLLNHCVISVACARILTSREQNT